MAKEAKKTQKKNSLDEKKKKEVKKEDTNKLKDEQEVVKVKKEKKVKDKKKEEKFDNFLRKVDDNRWPIILFVVGFLLATLIFRCIFWPDRIATLKDGTQPVATLKDEVITADDLYEDMKEYYSVKVLLNTIDDMILSKKYPSTDEMEDEIKNTAEYYYSVYENSYGYTKETFLSQYGFNSEKDFLDSLRLDYRKNKYYEDYALELVTDSEIEKYYKDEVFGDVDSKHILVSTGDDGLSDEEAKKLAKGDFNLDLKDTNKIQEIEELSNTLNTVKVELNKTDELRRDLMANVSHDLKTPLTMIKATAEIAKDLHKDNFKKQEEDMNTIISETDRLTILVNDILDLSKMESVIEELEIEEFDLIKLIKEILKKYEELEEIEKYHFIFQSKEKEILVKADKKKIEQVIYNLINNAINYTGEDNKVLIKLIKDNNIRVEVSDTGKGIKEEDIPYIWDKYYKNKKKHKRKALRMYSKKLRLIPFLQVL